MSTQEDKIKRSERIHKDEVKAHKQAKIMKAHGIDVRDDKEHFFHKKHAMNFGNRNYVTRMNPRKETGEKTIQELKFPDVNEFFKEVNNEN